MTVLRASYLDAVVYGQAWRDHQPCDAHVRAWREHRAFAQACETHGGEVALRVIVDAPLARARAITRAVAEAYALTSNDLRGASRKAHVVLPRHIAIARVHAETSWSLLRVGRFFDRDHTSVLHAVRRVARLRAAGELPSSLFPASEVACPVP